MTLLIDGKRILIINLTDYIDLVDWTGRIIRDNKRGAISEAAPPILQRLDISTEHWIELTTKFEQRFKGIAGSAHSIKTLCAHFGLTRTINRSKALCFTANNSRGLACRSFFRTGRKTPACLFELGLLIQISNCCVQLRCAN